MSEGLSGILDLFTGALDTANTFIDMVVDLLVAVVDAALELIAGVVAALVDILSVALPDIPIVSALFKTLTKKDMTALNLAALLVAIPTTIVYKAVAGHAPGEQSAAMAEVPWEKIAQIVKDLVEAIVEPIKDIVKSLPDGWIFAAMSAGLGLIGFGLGFSALIEKDDPATILYCVAGVVPILLTAAGFVLKKLGSEEAEPFASQAAPVISSGYGAVMMTMSAAYAAAFQGSYVDPDGLPLAAGVVGRLPALLAILPLITESLELSEQAGEAIVITASGVCPVIVALIEGAELAVDGAA